MKTNRSFLPLFALLCAVALPTVGCEREAEINTPDGEVEVETNRDLSGRTEEVEVDRN